MKLKLTIIAAGLALGFAGAAQAQSSTSMDRKVHSADEDRIEADYKAAKERCDTLQGNKKDICVAEAKGKEKVAKAENDAKTAKNPVTAQRKIADAKADANYDVAKERCDEHTGNQKDVCVKDAKAAHERAKADAVRAERSASTGGSAPAKQNR